MSNNKFKRKQAARQQQKIASLKGQMFLGGYYFYKCDNFPYNDNVLISKNDLLDREQMEKFGDTLIRTSKDSYFKLSCFISISEFKEFIKNRKVWDLGTGIKYSNIKELQNEVLIIALAGI